MKSLELKIPPVALVFIFAALMSLVTYFIPSFISYGNYHNMFAVISLSIGVIVAIAGVFAFRQAQTTVNPLSPDKSSELVVTGIYHYSRNPMYVGFLLALFALSLLLNSPVTILFCLIFVCYMNRFQIKPEERALSQLFGDEYLAYQQQVRRWF